MEGKVGVMGHEHGELLSSIKSGEFFEVDEESSQNRKLKVL